MIGVESTRSARQAASRHVMALLAAGVPLTLLIDLVAGPLSEQVLVHERLTQLTQLTRT